MDAKALLELIAKRNFEDLCETTSTVEEAVSWAVVPLKEGEYLNTDGAILSMVQHVACCKRMYASAAFMDGEVRWRDCADRYDAIGSDWAKTVEDLRDAQRYWLASWNGLTAEDLEGIRLSIRGKELPAWRIINAMAQHDAYHAGQIEILKVTLQPSETPPPSMGDDIRKYCRDLPNW